MKAKSSVGILILKEDSVLLVKHGPDSMHLQADYGLPSGKVDKGETELRAAVRELSEETGLITTEADLILFPGNYYSAHIKLNDGSNHLWGWRVFLCPNYQGNLRSTTETEPMWIQIGDLPSLSPKMPNVEEEIGRASCRERV